MKTRRVIAPGAESGGVSTMVALIVSAFVCTSCSALDEGVPPGHAEVEVAEVAARPDGTLLLVPPVEGGEVVAYVSRAEQRIYVARTYRDQVQNVFNAHISVSTGHWRIPLPGDSPMEPLTPGVPEREFEEFAMEDFDPTSAEPTLGDFRIISGGYTRLHLQASCLSLDDGASYVQTMPLNVAVNDGSQPQVVRENFMEVGAVQLFQDAACATATATAPAVMWASPSGPS